MSMYVCIAVCHEIDALVRYQDQSRINLHLPPRSVLCTFTGFKIPTVVYIEQLVKEQKVHPDDYDEIDKIQCIKCKIPLGYHVHDLSKRN
jgi:hypothetical protein